MKKVAIIGCGLTGCTIANKLAQKGIQVDIFEKNKNEVGGMCAEYKVNGQIIAKYGPHIFHTNNEDIWNFIKRFGVFDDYEHQVLSITKEGLMNYPINLETLEEMFGKENTLDNWKKDIDKSNEATKNDKESFEKSARNAIGDKLYNNFIKQYTETQWQRKATEIPAEIFTRVRVEMTKSRKFFNDKYVKLPRFGFDSIINFMISYDNIKVIYKTINRSNIKFITERYDKVISTIPPHILLGEEEIEYVAVSFLNKETDLSDKDINMMKKINVNVLNLCNNKKYTRMTNYTRMFKENMRHIEDTENIIIEYPNKDGIKMYPIRTEENIKRSNYQKELLYSKYKIISAGRLGNYKYLNMDEAILEGIQVAKNIIKEME